MGLFDWLFGPSLDLRVIHYGCGGAFYIKKSVLQFFPYPVQIEGTCSRCQKHGRFMGEGEQVLDIGGGLYAGTFIMIDDNDLDLRPGESEPWVQYWHRMEASGVTICRRTSSRSELPILRRPRIKTPEEIVQENRWREENNKREQELAAQKQLWIEEARKLDFLLQMKPDHFQNFIWILYERMGWVVTRTPYAQDGGADGIIERAGQKFVLQCKRYRKDVGEPVVRDLYGTYLHMKATGGVLITTGRISAPAIRFATNKNIDLIDGNKLLTLINDSGITSSMIPDSYIMKQKPMASRQSGAPWGQT